jgi:hypothetical protein
MIKSAVIGILAGLAYMGVSGDAIHPLIKVSAPDTFAIIEEDSSNFNCALQGNHICSDDGILQAGNPLANFWFTETYDA